MATTYVPAFPKPDASPTVTKTSAPAASAPMPGASPASTRTSKPANPAQAISPQPTVTGDEPGVDNRTTPEPNSRLARSLASLPVCGAETRLSLSPLAVDDYLKIIPLGLLDPPQHVLPTEHIFYRLKGENSDDGVNPATNPAAVVDVRALGNVRILEIDYTVGIGESAYIYSGHYLMFAPCGDQIYKLIHVTTINDQLIQLLQETEPLRCNEYPVGERYYRYCVPLVEFYVPVGMILGTAGGSVIAALDLEAYDLSTPPLAYANPERYRFDLNKRMHIVCPLDGFTPEAREGQVAKVEGYQDGGVTAWSICGVAMQDRPGTTQGNWFVNWGVSGFTDISKKLALAHHHVYRNSGAISVGGTIMDMGVWVFTEKEGLINREFDQVVPDGQIYCYQGVDFLRKRTRTVVVSGPTAHLANQRD